MVLTVGHGPTFAPPGTLTFETGLIRYFGSGRWQK